MAGLRIRTRVCVQLGGHSLEFRPLTIEESADIVWEVEAFPESEATLCDQVCEKACLSDLDKFAALIDEYPLVCAETILVAILKEGGDQAMARLDAGVKSWKAADRDYGRTAQHLLAFKAYTGGDYTKDQMAGALALAETFGTIKGLFQLVHSYIKGMRR